VTRPGPIAIRRRGSAPGPIAIKRRGSAPGPIAIRRRGSALHFCLDRVSRVSPAASGSRIASWERSSDLGIAVTGVGGQFIRRVPLQVHERHRRWWWAGSSGDGCRVSLLASGGDLRDHRQKSAKQKQRWAHVHRPHLNIFDERCRRQGRSYQAPLGVWYAVRLHLGADALPKRLS